MSEKENHLTRIARELFWWQSAEVSLAAPARFLSQMMTLGTWEEILQVKEVLGWVAFRKALENAPAGVFDARSWFFWRNYFGLPEVELPHRSLK